MNHICKTTNFITKTTPLQKRWVVAAIEGHFEVWKKLWEKKIKAKKEDQIFIMGNFLGDGKQNLKLLKHFIKLKEEGYQIFWLRGQKEETILRMAHKGKSELKWFLKENACDDLLENGKIPLKFSNFLHQTAYFYQSEETFIVQAGFNQRNPFQNRETMLYSHTGDIDFYTQSVQGQRLIYGQKATSLTDLMESINTEIPVIALNNGNATNGNPREWGNLCALQLEENIFTFEALYDWSELLNYQIFQQNKEN